MPFSFNSSSNSSLNFELLLDFAKSISYIKEFKYKPVPPKNENEVEALIRCLNDTELKRRLCLEKDKFNDYSTYSEFNTKVYNYIDTYLGNSAKKEELKKRLIEGSLNQDEFYN